MLAPILGGTTCTFCLILVAVRATDSVPLRDGSVLRERIEAAPFREALAVAWQVDDLEGVLGRHVAGPGLADLPPEDSRWAPDTADRNRIEFGFARSVSRSRTSVVAAHVLNHDTGAFLRRWPLGKREPAVALERIAPAGSPSFLFSGQVSGKAMTTRCRRVI